MTGSATIRAIDDGSMGSLGTTSAADVTLVTQVVLAERQGRDRGWWAQMAELYWPDSTVRLSWYKGDGAGFVTGSEAMAQRGEVALHQMYAPIVHIRGDRAHVEASATMRIATEVEGVSGDLVVHSRLNYRLERRDGRWGIYSMDAIYEHATLTPVVPGQSIKVAPEDLARFRPSYAILAWNIARRGIPVSADELGDDQPECVRQYYATVRDWLNGQ